MIVGEAPGKREDDSGKPFVGRSGELLMKILATAGFKREDVYITNAVHCRPPNNETPKKKEINACKKWLDYEIAMVKPKFILVLGNTPLQSLTGKTGIKKARGKPIELDGRIILPTFHPAFALRDETQIKVIERDIKIFKDIIDFGGIPEERDLNYSIIDTWPKFRAMLKKLSGSVAVDLETNCLYPWERKNKKFPDHVDAHIVSVSIAIANGQFVIPLNHDEAMWPVFDDGQQKMWDELIPALNDCDVIGQNLKFDAVWIWVHSGHRLRIDFDTMLAHYMLDENSLHDLEYLASFYFGAPAYDIPLTEKHGHGPLERHCKYAAADVFYARKLKFRLLKELREDLAVKKVFDKLMMPIANLFVEIEYHGIFVNRKKMKDAEVYLRGELAAAQETWDKWGKGVNMRSPQQLAEFFFNKLKIKVIDKTPKGAPSTSESVLKRIDHPAAAALLRFRGAAQQLSFFIEGWEPFLDGSRLHPSFKLHGTVTGRPSCEHPNLQQVPRDPRIRSLITAEPGWSLLDADLSQIELRIAAWLADERTMIRMLNEGIDVHWLTCLNDLARGGGEADLILKTAKAISNGSKIRYAEAIQILLKAGPDAAVDIDKSWKELRKKAKAVNFGYLYGMWWKKFKIYARDNYGVTVTDEEAQASRESFFETYSDFTEWHKSQKRYARRNGFVSSPTGRKRRLPAALHKEDTKERQEAERQAVNSPVQGFAAELNLMVALQLRSEFSDKVLRIGGTVHDAILAAVRDDYKERVAKRMLEIMTGPDLLKEFGIEIPVPILGEVKIGPWSEGKTFHV
jgi:uracil-DNA glycosylase family 4